MINKVFKTLYQSDNHPENIWIICPFAGGSLSAFNSWTKLDKETLPGKSLVMLATYPGRDQRISEQPMNTIHALALDIFDAFLDWKENNTFPLNTKIRLCGHSMGAQVAFEIGKKIEEHYGSASPVTQIILSGCHAPHLESRRKLSHLNDNDFVDQLINIGSGSSVLKQHPELQTIFLPMLRADFFATETYEKKLNSAPQLHFIPCTLVFGESDPEAWQSEAGQWANWFSTSIKNNMQLVAVAGEHFYLTTTPAVFIDAVMNHLPSSTLLNSNTTNIGTTSAIFGEKHGY